MIFTALIIAISAALTAFMGYWAHRFFHKPVSGPFYKAHMNHHTIQYPPGDLTSDTYRDAGKDSTLWYFALAFSPLMIMVVLSHFVIGVSIWTCACILASMIGTGILHDRVHDAFHLNKSLWQYVPFFKRWQELHNIHHIDMNMNYGIFSFIFDKMFKTFQNK